MMCIAGVYEILKGDVWNAWGDIKCRRGMYEMGAVCEILREVWNAWG